MTSRIAWMLFSVAAVHGITAGRVRAGELASDSAADPAYANGWQGENGVVPEEIGMDNGGSGFLPWRFDNTFWNADASPYPQPHFIDTTAAAPNDLGAPAFALTNFNEGHSGSSTAALRPFAQAMNPGDTFRVDIDNPVMQQLEPLDNTGFIIRMLDESAVERFGLYTYFGFNNNEWTFTDEIGSGGVTNFSDVAGSTGFNYALTVLEDDFYELTLTPKNGDPALHFAGGLAHFGAGPIAAVEFTLYGNGSSETGDREFYFSNLLITDSDAEVLGDTNGDGAVNLDDLNNVRNFFGTPQDEGDADHDGDTDLDDLNAVRNNFGVGGSVAVPEPGSLLLASVVVLALCRRRS